MQTFEQLASELKLTSEQKIAIEKFFSQMVIEFLESIKQDNIQNFDETINSINK